MPETYLNLLPLEIYQLILEHKAAIIIQELAFKRFYKNHGPNWKREIRILYRTTIVLELDYLSYLHGVADPWYDYSDDPMYAY